MTDPAQYTDLVTAADQWRDALDFAEDKRDELAVEVETAYAAGLSMRGIAEVTGLHRNTVRKMLGEAGARATADRAGVHRCRQRVSRRRPVR